MYLLLCYNISVLHKAVMYTAWLMIVCILFSISFLLWESLTWPNDKDLLTNWLIACWFLYIITKDKEINKPHFKEKVLNHFTTQEQNDTLNVIATYLWTWNVIDWGICRVKQ